MLYYYQGKLKDKIDYYEKEYKNHKLEEINLLKKKL